MPLSGVRKGLVIGSTVALGLSILQPSWKNVPLTSLHGADCRKNL